MANNSVMTAADRPRDLVSREADIDRRNLDWFIDKLVQILVFIGGISAM